MTPSVVLSRPSPCNVPQGYASVAGLPAALLGCHFEHPVRAQCLGQCYHIMIGGLAGAPVALLLEPL